MDIKKEAEKLAKNTLVPFDDLDIPNIETPEPSYTQAETAPSNDVLTAILTFLRDNWPDGEPVPIILGGETVGYYDKQLGVRAQMRRRGVI